MVPSTSHATPIPSTDNNTNINPTTTSERADSNSSIKHASIRNKKLTRLRSFFFRTSSRAQQQQPALSNQISTT
jgi:hypothetical protein